MIINKEIGVNIREVKTKLKESLREVGEPGPWGLLEAVDGLVQSANMMRVSRINKAAGLLHEHVLS
jgi:hypothetical protein